MPRYLFTIILCLSFSLLCSAQPQTADEKPSIKHLDWLIGVWDYDDSQVNGDYRETGVRTCSYQLNDLYILCESVGETHTGRRRVSHWYFNYNDRNERFEMVAVFGDYPSKNLYVLIPSDNGRTIELINNHWSTEGLVRNNSATIVYDGEDQYVWNIRSGSPNPETGEHPVTFRDTVTRRQ